MPPRQNWHDRMGRGTPRRSVQVDLGEQPHVKNSIGMPLTGEADATVSTFGLWANSMVEAKLELQRWGSAPGETPAEGTATPSDGFPTVTVLPWCYVVEWPGVRPLRPQLSTKGSAPGQP